MAKFRKKPVVIEAIRFRGDNRAEIEQWAQKYSPCWPNDWVFTPAHVTIPTLEGAMLALPGDYIICGVAHEFYPCKPGIFAATYEPVAPESKEEAGQ